MKQTVNLSDFRTAFHQMNRGEQFTYEGLEILFEYLESLESDIGEEIELDVIAFCCEFAESEPLEIAENYSIELGDEAVDPENVFTIVREFLEDEGVLVGETDTTLVYRQF
jgi:hypothetical protein